MSSPNCLPLSISIWRVTSWCYFLLPLRILKHWRSLSLDRILVCTAQLQQRLKRVPMCSFSTYALLSTKRSTLMYALIVVGLCFISNDAFQIRKKNNYCRVFIALCICDGESVALKACKYYLTSFHTKLQLICSSGSLTTIGIFFSQVNHPIEEILVWSINIPFYENQK